MENKNFSLNCFLPAFYMEALGPAVSLELFASSAYVASYHAYHTYLHLVSLGRCHGFASRKLHVSIQTVLVSFINLTNLYF